jgi:hypothetical protein
LRVKINNDARLSCGLGGGGDMQGQRRFPRAALLAQDGNNFHIAVNSRLLDCWQRGKPPPERMV